MKNYTKELFKLKLAKKEDTLMIFSKSFWGIRNAWKHFNPGDFYYNEIMIILDYILDR